MKVILLMATTLDGKIAKDSDHFADWTEKADKKLFVELTKRAGVLVMGSKTHDTIGRPLPGRKNIVLTRDKNRTSDNPDLVFSSDPPRQILKDLAKEGFTEVILAGGQKINTLFVQENLIDEIILTVSPIIFGQGLSLFDENISLQLQLEKQEKLGENSVTLYYKVIK